MILKRLILIEWFKSFLTSFLVLILLVSVSHLISEFLKGNLGPSIIFVDFFFQLPSLLNKVIPVCCIFGSLLSINRLINRNELVAIFATGFSRKSFLMTIAWGSFLIAIIQFYNVGFLIPHSVLQKEINLNPGSKALKGEGLRKIFLDKGKFWYKQEDYFLSFSGFNQNSDELRNVYLLRFDKNHNLSEVIEAKKIEYRENHNWLFSGVTVYSELANLEFPKINHQESLLLWLHEIPQDFKEIQANISTLNFIELGKYIERFKKSEINTSSFEVLYLDMIASSIICVIFALLASMPLFYPNRRGNPFGRYLIYVFFFTLIYWFAYSYLLEIGKNSKMDVFLAVFLLPASFLIFLAFFFKKHNKLSA